MGNFEKFLFETSFDSQREREAKARAAAEAEAAAEPPPPSFSEEELEAARQAAYAEGRAAGLAEAEESHSRRLAEGVAALPPQFEALAQQLSAQEEERRRSALDAAIAVVRKLFPRLARDRGMEEVQAVVDDCLERLRDEPRLVVRSTDADLDAIKARVEQSAKQSGFEGKLVFLADETIASGDLRIEWADGGAERDQAALWQEIDAILARALKPAQQPRAPQQPAPKAAPEPNETTAPAGAPTPSQPQTTAEIEPLRRAQSA
ncbi:MAG: hypothetical protein Tsb0032_14000 [Kiloniellaceae bacterium]